MLHTLPPPVTAAIDAFVRAARTALGADLIAIVLFGSAAAGQLRATSDVNLLVVLRRFDAAAIDVLRPAAEQARLAVQLRPMWVLADELPHASEAFAVKYGDMARRHVVLHGADPFAGLRVPRAAQVAQLRQMLLNLVLRLRAVLVDHGQHPTRLGAALADAAGPLRVAAAALLELEGRPAPDPKQALAQVAGPTAADALRMVSAVREGGALRADTARPTYLAMLALAGALRARAEALQP